MPKVSGMLLLTLTVITFSAQAQTLNGHWVQPRGNDLDRADLVIGGSESNGAPLPVCHALYNGAVLPGKLVGGKCNVAFQGQEIVLENFELLAGNNDERLWAAPGLAGAVAFNAGESGDRPTRICRAKLYERDGDFLGTHPGRVVEGTCAVTFRGQEFRRNDYQILYASLAAPVSASGAPAVSEGRMALNVNHLACIAIASAALNDSGFTERSGTSSSMVYANHGSYAGSVDCYENPSFAVFVVAGPKGSETSDLERALRRSFENGVAAINNQ